MLQVITLTFYIVLSSQVLSINVLGLLQTRGPHLAICPYIKSSLGIEEGSCYQLSAEWAQEDGLTTLLAENEGNWWDVDQQDKQHSHHLGQLVWRWGLFEASVSFHMVYFCLC